MYSLDSNKTTSDLRKGNIIIVGCFKEDLRKKMFTLRPVAAERAVSVNHSGRDVLLSFGTTTSVGSPSNKITIKILNSGIVVAGAIFGTSAPHFLAGWKSDFTDKEENVHALVFFLDHATNANLEFTDGDKTYRFIDVPLENCGKASPVRVVIQMGASEMLMILLRFGARITFDNTSSNPVETILDRLNEYNRKYPYELVTCLKLILRAIPRVVFTVDRKVFEQLGLPEGYNCQRRIALEKYGDIVEDHLIPTTRCGLKPVELRHLCRCSIRKRLWENFQLPFGIQQLPIPKKLKKYLDLFTD